MTDLQGEMERRGGLELDRNRLLTTPAPQLGVAGHAITLDAMTTLMGPARGEPPRAAQRRAARPAQPRSAREHAINRALMRQELAFLDHLTPAAVRHRRPAATARRSSVRARACASAPRLRHTLLDLEA